MIVESGKEILTVHGRKLNVKSFEYYKKNQNIIYQNDIL